MASSPPVVEAVLAAETDATEAAALAPGLLPDESAFASVGEGLLVLDAPAVNVLALAGRASARNDMAYAGMRRHASSERLYRGHRATAAGKAHPALAMELDFDLLAGLDAVA